MHIVSRGQSAQDIIVRAGPTDGVVRGPKRIIAISGDNGLGGTQALISRQPGHAHSRTHSGWHPAQYSLYVSNRLSATPGISTSGNHRYNIVDPVSQRVNNVPSPEQSKRFGRLDSIRRS